MYALMFSCDGSKTCSCIDTLIFFILWHISDMSNDCIRVALPSRDTVHFADSLHAISKF